MKPIPYQECPVCCGIGRVLADGFIANVYDTCSVCNGKKIIPMYVPIGWHNQEENDEKKYSKDDMKKSFDAGHSFGVGATQSNFYKWVKKITNHDRT